MITAKMALISFTFVLTGIGIPLALGVRARLRTRAVRRQGCTPEPLPAELLAALQTVPLRQQPRAGKTYYGMGVRWRVAFQSVVVSGPRPSDAAWPWHLPAGRRTGPAHLAADQRPHQQDERRRDHAGKHSLGF